MLEARTVFYCAALSLLTAEIVAISPTEVEEIVRRAKMLTGSEKLAVSDDKYLGIEMKKWGFATPKEELEKEADNWIKDFPHSEVDCHKTYEDLCKLPHFRLERAKKLVYEDQPLPF